MVVADGAGLPLSVSIASASPNEITLVDAAVDALLTDNTPAHLIGDKAYDSSALDTRLRQECRIEMIAPHRRRRRRARTRDGRALRRYRHRWQIQRLFAWLHNFRRLVTRYERHAGNFLAFVQLGCIMILLRQFPFYEIASSLTIRRQGPRVNKILNQPSLTSSGGRRPCRIQKLLPTSRPSGLACGNRIVIGGRG